MAATAFNLSDQTDVSLFMPFPAHSSKRVDEYCIVRFGVPQFGLKLVGMSRDSRMSLSLSHSNGKIMSYYIR